MDSLDCNPSTTQCPQPQALLHITTHSKLKPNVNRSRSNYPRHGHPSITSQTLSPPSPISASRSTDPQHRRISRRAHWHISMNRQLSTPMASFPQDSMTVRSISKPSAAWGLMHYPTRQAAYINVRQSFRDRLTLCMFKDGGAPQGVSYCS